VLRPIGGGLSRERQWRRPGSFGGVLESGVLLVAGERTSKKHGVVTANSDQESSVLYLINSRKSETIPCLLNLTRNIEENITLVSEVKVTDWFLLQVSLAG